MSQGGTTGILIGNGSESGGCLGSSDKSKGLSDCCSSIKKCDIYFLFNLDDTSDDDDDDDDDDDLNDNDDDEQSSQQFSIPYMLQSPDAGN